MSSSEEEDLSGSGSASGSQEESNSQSDSGSENSQSGSENSESGSGNSESGSENSESGSGSGSDEKEESGSQSGVQETDQTDKNIIENKMLEDDLFTPGKQVSFRVKEPTISGILNEIESISSQVNGFISTFNSSQDINGGNYYNNINKYNQSYGNYRFQSDLMKNNNDNFQNNSPTAQFAKQTSQSGYFPNNFSEIPKKQEVYKEAYKDAYKDAYDTVVKNQIKKPQQHSLESMVQSQQLEQEELEKLKKHENEKMEQKLQEDEYIKKQQEENLKMSKDVQELRAQMQDEDHRKLMELEEKLKKRKGYKIREESQKIIDNYYKKLYRPKSQQFQQPQQLNMSNNINNQRTNSLYERVKQKSLEELIIQPSLFVTRQNGAYTSKYKLDKQLGEGAFGQVHKVISLQDKKDVKAMKIIKKESIPELERKNFNNEIEVQKTLDHKNIVKLYEYYEDAENIYVITEFFDGLDLVDAITQGDHFTESQAAEIIHQVLEGLSYSHKKKVMHRDIKPENIMVSKSSPKQVKIIDWGFSASFQNKLQKACGSLDYVAPEVLTQDFYDEKRDVWSVGCVLYVLLARSAPYTILSKDEIIGDSVYHISGDDETRKNIIRGKPNLKHPLLKDISDEGKNFIKRLLTYKPEKRPSSEEALNDPWFDLMLKNQNNQIQEKQKKLSLNSLKQFNVHHKLQQATLSYLASQKISHQESQKLQKTFAELDENNVKKDGMLSKDELIKGYSQLYSKEVAERVTQEIFDIIDVDQNGTIDYNEFISATMNLKTALSQKNLKQAFQLFDLDGDGFITAKEIKTVLDNGKTKNAKIWADLIKEADTDGDGQISFQEFLKFMKTIDQSKKKTN
ncbi:Protein kinase-like domain [Pseudocohnilembus persalinus]|uniref:non-specific serine/threonine protein kinase n=1 Tax=Pseudocohnilembus persalinus TaxID=266149 RepID=A0A0V0R1K3_PSEPJ|nr:Protein kinase-like domain [Pseudocohnilembus persalinus]|eukprot:KRX08237.1 Protein kinase-like domain [Pseudocohnilembus persalinus]